MCKWNNLSSKCALLVVLPHDAVNHFHNNFVNCVKEVDDNFALFAKRSQDGAEGQAEEYDAESVSSRPKLAKGE